jgi:hypothetical protein
MTTVEWATSVDPEEMLSVLHEARIGTDRLPVVLAGFAARGRLLALLSPGLREPFAAYARWAEGRGVRPEMARWEFDPLARPGIDVWDADDCVRNALGGCEYWLGLIAAVRAEACGVRRVAHFSRPPADALGWHRRQADALRDALGDPLRPLNWNRRWATLDAEGVARTIDEHEEFGLLPVLADALEEAGCVDGQVLGHCREPGPHFRGCWVVDLVLGKGRPAEPGAAIDPAM